MNDDGVISTSNAMKAAVSDGLGGPGQRQSITPYLLCLLQLQAHWWSARPKAPSSFCCLTSRSNVNGEPLIPHVDDPSRRAIWNSSYRVGTWIMTG